MKKTYSHPAMPAASKTFILNHFEEQAQEQAQEQEQEQAQKMNQGQAHDQEQEENREQTQDQDRALFNGRKEYCMADIWGEPPVLTVVTAKEDTTPPETEVVEEPKQSWLERLIRRFGSSGHRSLRIAQ